MPHRHSQPIKHGKWKLRVLNALAWAGVFYSVVIAMSTDRALYPSATVVACLLLLGWLLTR